MIKKKSSLLVFSLLLSSVSIYAQSEHLNDMRNSHQAIMEANIERENASILQELDSVKLINARGKDAESIVFDIEDVNVVRKLKGLEREIPLDYNQHVRKYIDTYGSKNYSGHMSKMLGLAQYYFPIFDRILAEVGVPKEIKYVSIIESSLNPHDVSRSGATGPWQFMYGTAKLYDLKMDNYVDERKDPVASSYAAAKYMKEAYAEFGDWLLAIASYNCGKGAVKRAILKSGKMKPTFWELSPLLPREAQNYIPKFIAMTYTLSYAQDHGIEANDAELALNTQELQIDKLISIAQVAKAVNLSEDVLKKLNPSYKKGVVNGSLESPRRLIIPQITSDFNKEQLYLALNSPLQNLSQENIENEDAKLASIQPKNHTVRRGETIAEVADKYNVSVQDLKNWNNLSNSKLKVGSTMTVRNSGISSQLAQKTNKAVERKSNYLVYIVKRGDTLSAIADRKGVSLKKLKADNDLSHSKLKPGMKLKIPKA